ncbi:hypothetical protein EBT31_05480 [bacterium]|nr:hypothetical protein [bacterium]NBT31168.1 hypothetical protein [Paracoccaceae bacterium]
MTYRRICYFLSASLTVLSQHPNAPANPWELTKLVAACIVGGLIALRALESVPDAKPPTNTLDLK